MRAISKAPRPGTLDELRAGCFEMRHEVTDGRVPSQPMRFLTRLNPPLSDFAPIANCDFIVVVFKSFLRSFSYAEPDKRLRSRGMYSHMDSRFESSAARLKEP